MDYLTEQENFWAGEFGNEYVDRNQSAILLSQYIAALSKGLSKADIISSSLELGSNIGYNELALQTLFPEIQMEAVEINKKAAEECSKIKNVKVHQSSVFDFETSKKFQLTFTSGFLIHIAPERLGEVYEKLYNYSDRYIYICEYYNPTPVEVEYRGNRGKLFKRDFAGEIMDAYPDLRLVDYGFIYHRDRVFPRDDITWFLLKKEIDT